VMKNKLLISAIKIITNLDSWYLSENPLRLIPASAWFSNPP